MKYGARPTERDPRDYSWNRTFGVAKPTTLPAEYSVDIGLTMPDQTILDPFSCTAYTTCDLGTDQDGVEYQPKYTYMKTLFIQGLPPETNGSDIRPALRSAKVYGLLPIEYTPELLKERFEDFTANQANWPPGVDAISGKLEHRKGKYFNVYDDGGLDWFDAFRSSMWINKGDKRGVSVGTPWFPEWGSAPSGILTNQFVYKGDPRNVGWHNYAIKGWKVIDGKQYLMSKPWQGRGYGDNGWAYFDRETINRVMEIRGSVAFTLADAYPKDIQHIKLDMFELIATYVLRMLRIKVYA